MIVNNYFNREIKAISRRDIRQNRDVVVPTFRNSMKTVEIGNLIIYFSFRTPIAVRHPSINIERKGDTIQNARHPHIPRTIVSRDIMVADNIWGKHTAFHLNTLDGGDTDSRVSWDQIKEKIKELVPIEIQNTVFIGEYFRNRRI